EPSAYLRSAAHQPVQWYAWSAEAFERAKREDKPILLDIGAVWCHWCHVLDHESYDDPAVAAIVNEHFVAVKVDRDERPDLDARYQQAVTAISGQGGWPLTGFLTPDGKVFFGGTYFPPVDAFGRPSFKRVLLSVAQYYRESREEAQDAAAQLHRQLAAREGSGHPGTLDPSLISQTSRATPPSSWRRCSTTMRVADFTAARTPISRRATTAATSPGGSTRPGPCSATTNFPCWLSITTSRGGERCTTILPGMCSMWTGIQTSWPRSCTGTSPTSAGCSAAAAKNLSPPAGNGRCRTSITPATQTGTAWPLPRSSTRL